MERITAKSRQGGVSNNRADYQVNPRGAPSENSGGQGRGEKGVEKVASFFQRG